MNSQAWTDSWRSALGFYDGLIGNGWEHIPEFRNLVANIADSKAARGLTAVTSHDVLTVSPYTTHPDWFDGRRIVLTPMPIGLVRIDHYPKGGTTDVRSHTLPTNQATSLVLELVCTL